MLLTTQFLNAPCHLFSKDVVINNVHISYNLHLLCEQNKLIYDYDAFFHYYRITGFNVQYSSFILLPIQEILRLAHVAFHHLWHYTKVICVWSIPKSSCTHIKLINFLKIKKEIHVNIVEIYLSLNQIRNKYCWIIVIFFFTEFWGKNLMDLLEYWVPFVIHNRGF